MISKLIELIIGKDIGGRMFLTIIAGLAFGYMVVTKAVDAKDAMLLIGVVFTLYFTRNDRQTTGNPGQNGGTK
jgi:hypothetical protein